jgi:antirestriction protein ArdC
LAAGCPVPIDHGHAGAFYAPARDRIGMPERAAFPDADTYYGTLLHEMVHATGHDSRLARTFGRRFGDDDYAREELVAELGAAFLCQRTGVEAEPREDHAAYLGHWLRVLRADKTAIVTAAQRAQHAADWLLRHAGMLESRPAADAPQEDGSQDADAGDGAAMAAK